MSSLIGMSIASGLLALIPSKKEQESDVPWCSIILALLSGFFFAVSGVGSH